MLAGLRCSQFEESIENRRQKLVFSGILKGPTYGGDPHIRTSQGLPKPP